MSSWWNDRENKQELQIDGFWLDSFSLEKKSLDFSLQMKSENKVKKRREKCSNVKRRQEISSFLLNSHKNDLFFQKKKFYFFLYCKFNNSR